MSIDNALASVAVRHVGTAAGWYERLLGAAPTRPMAEVAEWRFPRGGGLQVYQLPERAGACSFTLVVTDLDAEAVRLSGLGIDTSNRTTSDRVKTVMIVDPDGNHIALAEASDPDLVR